MSAALTAAADRLLRHRVHRRTTARAPCRACGMTANELDPLPIGGMAGQGGSISSAAPSSPGGAADLDLSQETLFDVADPGMERYATLSGDGLYRYTLHRRWDYDLPVLSWCCLNPSTANHLVDDNSSLRMISFSRAFGYGGLDLFNIFGLISTDPAGLLTADDPIGPDNDRYLLGIPDGSPLICAWGASVPTYWRHRPTGLVAQLRARGVDLQHLGLTKDGHPRHPLYLRGDTQPTRWAP